MGKHWNILLLEHLWYFAKPGTLERVMARYGFEHVTTRSLPYDAPVAHIATRLAQNAGMKGAFRAGPLFAVGTSYTGRNYAWRVP